MSLLPYILSELHDMSEAFDRRPRWERDDLDLLDDLLVHRGALAPARPVLRILDLDSPEFVPVHHHLVRRPRHQHQLRRQLSAPYRRALQQQLSREGKEVKECAKKDEGLLINVDVQQFRPEELSVQVLKDERCVVVEGKHEERLDEHGYVQRQFTRRYKLPDYVDPDTVSSKLSSDGVLQVSAPRREALPAPKENVRHVSITHTDRPAVQAAADEAVADKNVKGDEAVTHKGKPKDPNVDNEAVVAGA